MRYPTWFVAVSLLAAACGSSQPESAPPPVPPAQTPDVDLNRAVVALHDVHFDLFDGTSVPLSQSTPGLRERLLDAIPPIDEPAYEPAPGGDWLASDDLVLGYVTAGQAYAYPHKILNFHEIVNDVIGETPIVVTYCPLCRSGVVYDRRLESRRLDFSNTSALYQNDLVMVDRQTGTYWWQIAGRGIVGDLAGRALTPLPSSTATWAAWKETYPDTFVLSRDTGFDIAYEVAAFAGIEGPIDDGVFPFPVTVTDDRLPNSTLVLGVEMGEDYAAFPLSADAALAATVGDTDVVVFATGEPHGAAYSPIVDGDQLTFGATADGFRDNETGSLWTAAGVAVAGPLEGVRLDPIPSRTAFWYSYVGAFPGAEIVMP